jgi:hypothetical protein
VRPSNIGLLALAVLVSACSTDVPNLQSKAGPREWSKCTTLVNLQDKRIDESSGICSSRGVDGVYYTHNDSGDTARFFKFNRKGEILGVFNVTNALAAVDWEDIASATLDGKPYIFCGDIGDNAGVRKQIYVYRVPEPDPHPPTPSPLSRGEKSAQTNGGPRGEMGEGEQVRADRIYTLTYPDEPHNAETLMVNPSTGDIYIVTKAAKRPSMVFKLAHPGASGSYTLEKIGEFQVGGAIRESKLVTAGDISPDSKHVVIRTYFEGWEFDASAKFDDWFRQTPRRIQTNFELQGEGICYSRDGKSILTTSEGVPCQVSEARLRD